MKPGDSKKNKEQQLRLNLKPKIQKYVDEQREKEKELAEAMQETRAQKQGHAVWEWVSPEFEQSSKP